MIRFQIVHFRFGLSIIKFEQFASYTHFDFSFAFQHVLTLVIKLLN